MIVRCFSTVQTGFSTCKGQAAQKRIGFFFTESIAKAQLGISWPQDAVDAKRLVGIHGSLDSVMKEKIISGYSQRHKLCFRRSLNPQWWELGDCVRSYYLVLICRVFPSHQLRGAVSRRDAKGG